MNNENTTFKNNAIKIANYLNNLIRVEIKNIASNRTEVLKCGLWLTRLCGIASKYQLNIDINGLNNDYIKYTNSLSKIILIEIHDEYMSARKGKYNVKLLHNITKGLKLANSTWFN